MTKADLLILQDAAEEFSLESAENLGVNKSVCLQTAALSILCRVGASLMAGEGEGSVSPERMAQLLKARIDRCAELEAALKPYVVDYDEWMDTHSDSEMMSTYRRVTYGEHRAALRALRRPAQEEGK